MRIAFILWLIFAGHVHAQVLDRIVAIVNNDVILLSELEYNAKIWRANAQILPTGKTYQHRVLEQMINQKLQTNFLKFNNASVQGVTIDRAINQIAKNNNVTVNELLRRLPSQGVNEVQLRDKLRLDIERSRLRQLLITEDATFSEAELNTIISQLKNQHSTKKPPSYLVGHMLLSDQTLAKSILRQIQNGADFKTLAKTYSDAKSALVGGDLGWLNPDELPEAIRDLVATMREGEVKIVEKNGWHLVKLVTKKSSYSITLETLKKQARQIIIYNRLNRYLVKVLKKIRQEAYIEIRL